LNNSLNIGLVNASRVDGYSDLNDNQTTYLQKQLI